MDMVMHILRCSQESMHILKKWEQVPRKWSYQHVGPKDNICRSREPNYK